jgi:Flp pilus assembly protein TadD
MALKTNWLRIVLLVCALRTCCLAGTAAEDPINEASAPARAGDVKQAEALLRSASAANPDSAALHGALGKLLFTEQNYPDAVQELNVAQQLAPESREYNMLLAAALLGAKRYGVTVNFLHAVQSRFEQFPEFHYSLGLAYYNLIQFNKAEAEFREALRLNPKLDRAQFLLATSIASEGDTARAAGMLRRMTQEHPTIAVYWTTLGELLGKMGDENRPEALRACRKALEIAPGDPHTQFVMATILLNAGDFAGARPLLERLANLSPKEIEAHAALARVYARLGERELARKETEIVNQLQKEQNSENSAPAPTVDSKSSQQR